MYIDRYIYHYNCLLNFILYPIALFLTSTHCTCAGSESLCLEQVLMNTSQSWLAVKPKHVHVHFTAVLPNTKSNRQLASIPPTKKKIVGPHPWPHHLTIARPSIQVLYVSLQIVTCRRLHGSIHVHCAGNHAMGPCYGISNLYITLVYVLTCLHDSEAGLEILHHGRKLCPWSSKCERMPKVLACGH